MRCVGVRVVRERRSLVAFQRENTRLFANIHVDGNDNSR